MGPQRGGPKGQGMGTREKTSIGVRKVVYKIVQEALASVSTPKTSKKRIPHSKASTSKRRKSHIDTTWKFSEEAPPVPQETIFDLNREHLLIIRVNKQPLPYGEVPDYLE